jgi:two-component system, response regulator PdtaR
VFNGDRQIIARMEPHLQRILVVDPNPSGAKFLTELLREIGRAQVWSAATVERGLKVAAACEPQIIFVELQTGLDGLAFTRKLRRSVMKCRQAPVIATTEKATAATILGARDAGVHEFLRKPFSMKDLLRRLEAVTLRHRDWVEGVAYVGPDRRRFNSGDYTGPLKRDADNGQTPDDLRLQQALKILRAALTVIEKDPQQAVRAMQAQVVILHKVAAARGDAVMNAGAEALRKELQFGTGGSLLTHENLEPLITPLMKYMKADASREAA